MLPNEIKQDVIVNIINSMGNTDKNLEILGKLLTNITLINKNWREQYIEIFPYQTLIYRLYLIVIMRLS